MSLTHKAEGCGQHETDGDRAAAAAICQCVCREPDQRNAHPTPGGFRDRRCSPSNLTAESSNSHIKVRARWISW
jgi:hypothetical protein